MKILALALFLVATPVFGQIAAPPPSPTAHVPNVISDNTKVANDFVSVVADWNAFENWLKTSLKLLDDQRIIDEQTITDLRNTHTQDADALQSLSARVAALEKTAAPVVPPISSPIHIEAESFTTSAPLALTQLTETSTVNNNICCLTAATSATADYTVTIPVDGNYVVTARTSTNRDALTVAFSSGIVTTGPIPVVNTGGWQTYTILTGATPLALKAGAQTIRLTYAQYVNIDYFELTLKP